MKGADGHRWPMLNAPRGGSADDVHYFNGDRKHGASRTLDMLTRNFAQKRRNARRPLRPAAHQTSDCTVR
jgi:hypothetical protein